MKKIFTLLILAMLTLMIRVQAQTAMNGSPQPPLRIVENQMTPSNGLPREINDFKWNSGNWTPHRHVDVKYTEDGHVEEETVVYADGSSYRYTYSHDDWHDYTYEEKKVDGQWVPSTRWTYGYDLYGYEVEYLEEAYQGGQWVVLDKWVWEYEYVGRLVASMILKKFDENTKALVNDYKMLYTYNSQNQVDYDILMDFMNNTFINQSKTVYTYTKENRINTAERFMWANNAWAQNTMGTYTYTGTLSYTLLWGMWNNSQKKYFPYFRETYNFDEKNNPVLYQYEFDPNMSGNWSVLMGNKYFNTYDGNKLVEMIIQEWKTGGPEMKTTGWVNLTKTVYSNFLNLGIEDPEAVLISVNVYPNPVSGNSQIISGILSPKPFVIEVYSMEGTMLKQIQVPPGTDRFSMDVSALAAGNYIIIVKDNSGIIARQKIIRE